MTAQNPSPTPSQMRGRRLPRHFSEGEEESDEEDGDAHAISTFKTGLILAIVMGDG